MRHCFPVDVNDRRRLSCAMFCRVRAATIRCGRRRLVLVGHGVCLLLISNRHNTSVEATAMW